MPKLKVSGKCSKPSIVFAPTRLCYRSCAVAVTTLEEGHWETASKIERTDNIREKSAKEMKERHARPFGGWRKQRHDSVGLKIWLVVLLPEFFPSWSIGHGIIFWKTAPFELQAWNLSLRLTWTGVLLFGNLKEKSRAARLVGVAKKTKPTMQRGEVSVGVDSRAFLILTRFTERCKPARANFESSICCSIINEDTNDVRRKYVDEL